jgi:hypothetical protein
VYQVNNSVNFIGKSMKSEEFLGQMIEVLVNIIDRSHKEIPRKMES